MTLSPANAPVTRTMFALKPTLGRSIAAALLLVAQFIASLLQSAAHGQRLMLLARLRHGVRVTGSAFRASDFVIVGGSRIALPLTVATAIAFLMWLYRASENVHTVRGGSLEFTPGGAVGSFFIPFLNLVQPYRAVREVWLASDPSVLPPVPMDRGTSTGQWLVLAWWIPFLTRGLSGWWSLVASHSDLPRIEKLASVSYGLLASHLLAMPAAAAAIALVYLVDQRQNALGTALEPLDGDASAVPVAPSGPTD